MTMTGPTDAEVYAKFMEHVKKLEAQAIAGDLDAVRSLACMALLAEGFRYNPDDGGETVDLGVNENVVDLREYRGRLAA